jgi:hypothetical protein
MTEMTNGDKPAARTRLNAPSYESVVAACRWATRHNSGRPLLAVSESDRALQIAFSSSSRQQEALRAVLDLGYAASTDNELSLVVTGWDSQLLAQRADRGRVELRALEIAHREVASATLGRLRDQRAAGIVDDAAVAAAGAVVDTENLQLGGSDAADARPAWRAVPITPVEIGTASGTPRAQLVNIAATEQAILVQHNTTAAEIARSTVKLFFEYRDRHGYDDREAAGYAFADMAEEIDSAYEIAWRAVSRGAEEARAGGGHHAPSVNVAAVQEHGPPSSSQRSRSVEDALTDLAGVFGDSMTAVEVGRHVTCTEADAIARALLAGGHRAVASQWLDGHARGDAEAEEDRHVGNDFDLETYLDGLDPRGHLRRAAGARGHDQPTAAGREPIELGYVGAAHGAQGITSDISHTLGPGEETRSRPGERQRAEDVHLTLTFVVRANQPPDSGPETMEFDTAQALVTKDATMFFGVEPGVTNHARSMGADSLLGQEKSYVAGTRGRAAPPDLDQWAPVVGELAGSAVVEDPAWPRLAAAIDRAHAAGWDVREGVPRLLAQQDMPDRHPARELHYRLLGDCPAAMPTPQPRVEADEAPTTRRGVPPEPAAPTVTQTAPER